MWTLAPVDNENKKLTKAEYNYFKKTSKVCSFIVTLISLVLFCFFQAHIYLLSLLIGVFSATISIIVGYFQQKNICN
jgi:accessory gene regulator protein AgrB